MDDNGGIPFIVFFIRPIHVDPRFGVGVGAAFAAIAKNIYVGASIPATNRFTLMAIVNALGIATLLLTLVQSALSLYSLDTLGQEKLYRVFDKVSFAVFLIGYTVANLMLPLAAMP
jgi:MFS family permease